MGSYNTVMCIYTGEGRVGRAYCHPVHIHQTHHWHGQQPASQSTQLALPSTSASVTSEGSHRRQMEMNTGVCDKGKGHGGEWTGRQPRHRPVSLLETGRGRGGCVWRDCVCGRLGKGGDRKAGCGCTILDEHLLRR